MYSIRLFAIRHARSFERLYNFFERCMVAADPLFRKIGYERVEKPVALVEWGVKTLLFDCKMCGQCVLSSTGMSCPMNCPKNLRNGPCGGVRPGGYCEVKPEMLCVWALAWEGAERMENGMERIRHVQPPVNRSIEGSSSWLRVAREKAAEGQAAMQSKDPSKQAMADAFGAARKAEPASAPLAKEPLAAMSEQSVKETTTVFSAGSGANKEKK